MKQQPIDLAIVGAGPAGSVCACSARATDRNLSVALIDRETFPRDKSCGDAIREDAITMLIELGMGHVFSGRSQIHRLQSTVPEKFGYIKKLVDFDKYSYSIVERKILDHSIYQYAVDQGAQNLAGYALSDAAFDENARLWTLKLEGRSGSPLVLQTKVLVGADGASSRVRRIAGLELNSERYMAVGIRAYARVQGVDEGLMRVDFLKHLIPGYGWLFPLRDDKANIGVVLDQRDYKSYGNALKSHLEYYMRYLADIGIVLEEVHSIKTHPLPLSWSELPITPCRQVALIGDAAAMIDPFTGEGIHFGIWAGIHLGKSVAESLNKHDLQGGIKDYAKAYHDKHADFMANSQHFRTTIRFQRIML
ncbi:MAG: NAD(P)/FAD-dependent oxidoreductase [Gammaproteobacteria bacterium]|nr:NAD(P)/FAD-dependent oxidoreductase [Gammaproteobacteria bacterium]